MSRRATVFSPGLGQAILAWLAATRHGKVWLADTAGMSTSTLHPLFTKERTTALNFDRIAAVVPEPWTRPYCALTERPAMPMRARPEPRGRDYSFRRIKTPSLDNFAGIEGGWC